MAFLLNGWFKTDEDDINDLPPEFRDIYVNPWKPISSASDDERITNIFYIDNIEKILDVAKDGTPWELRDAFRQRCLQMTPHFTGLQVPTKRDFRQNTNPWDILNTLRPLETKVRAGSIHAATGAVMRLQRRVQQVKLIVTKSREGVCVAPSARACKMLTVRLHSALTSFGGKGAGGMPRISFTVEVSYCMRIHRVERFQGDFERLHAKLSAELIILPCFPEGRGITSFVGGSQELGREFCKYVQRVHSLLARRGVFSARLMEFLEVDFGRVHIEEEGRVIGENLDSRNLLPDTCWQIVEQSWLIQWRKFVLGRGARRYHAPGKIDNMVLFSDASDGSCRDPSSGSVGGGSGRGEGRKDASEHESGTGRSKRRARFPEEVEVSGKAWPRKGLVLGEDYRVVNYNVWKYWIMVYGGGPSIGRASKDIYGRPAIAYAAAVVKVQAVVRGFLGKKRAWREYFTRLAAEHAGAKEVLYERALSNIQTAAHARIKSARRKRRQGRVTGAVLFTQINWRRKKGYTYQVDKLETQQYIQDVFEKADNSICEPPRNKPMVVREVKSIVNIGGAEEYDVRFDENTGLNIGLRQRGSQLRPGKVAAVRNARRRRIEGAGERMGSGRGRDGGETSYSAGGRGPETGAGGEQTIVFKVPPELRSQVKNESVLLAINSMPITNLSHGKAMAHIRQASWPLVLRFRLPLEERDVFSLAKIAEMRADGRFSDEIVLEHVKRKLLRGQKLLRFPTRTGLFGSKPYLTLLSIDDHNLYYQGRDRVSLPEASRRGIMLYDLKFVTSGKATDALRKGGRRLGEDTCFSLAAEGKTLDFAVPPTMPDDGKSSQSLIHEMQGSQVYVDKDGAVKRRVRPKHMLTTVQRRRRPHEQQQAQH